LERVARERINPILLLVNRQMFPTHPSTQRLTSFHIHPYNALSPSFLLFPPPPAPAPAPLPAALAISPCFFLKPGWQLLVTLLLLLLLVTQLLLLLMLLLIMLLLLLLL